MGIRQIFGANLKNLRRKRGLSQEELAHRAEIDRTYVSALERGVYSVTIDIIERLAKVLKVEAADLLKKADKSG
jgi:transcriptional regulator with XRE-family HTH domain